MNRRYLPLVGALLILISESAIRAAVIVKSEQVNAANPAGKVKTIPGPSKSDSVSPPKVTDVWVAFKTHFDIGYTDTIEGVLRKYRVKMMDGALGIIGQERQLPPEKRFAWTIPGWPAGAHPGAAARAGPQAADRAGRAGRDACDPCPAVQSAHGIE